MDKKSLALLMPLFPMSLSEIIEANHGIEVPFDRFLIITRGLLLAGSLFHKSGLALVILSQLMS